MYTTYRPNGGHVKNCSQNWYPSQEVDCHWEKPTENEDVNSNLRIET